jgi:hypothetical protein
MRNSAGGCSLPVCRNGSETKSSTPPPSNEGERRLGKRVLARFPAAAAQAAHSLGVGSSIRIEDVSIIELQYRVLALFPHKAITGDEYLDLATHEAAKAVLWCADDRLAAHVDRASDFH